MCISTLLKFSFFLRLLQKKTTFFPSHAHHIHTPCNLADRKMVSFSLSPSSFLCFPTEKVFCLFSFNETTDRPYKSIKRKGLAGWIWNLWIYSFLLLWTQQDDFFSTTSNIQETEHHMNIHTHATHKAWPFFLNLQRAEWYSIESLRFFCSGLTHFVLIKCMYVYYYYYCLLYCSTGVHPASIGM